MPHLTCEACQQEFSTPWKNATTCPTCRILRDIDHCETRADPRPRQCVECKKDFWPIRTTYRKCYECTDWMKAGKRMKYTCNVCFKHNKPAVGMNTTCVACVQSSRKNRLKYYQALKERFLKVLQTEG